MTKFAINEINSTCGLNAWVSRASGNVWINVWLHGLWWNVPTLLLEMIELCNTLQCGWRAPANKMHIGECEMFSTPSHVVAHLIENIKTRTLKNSLKLPYILVYVVAIKYIKIRINAIRCIGVQCSALACWYPVHWYDNAMLWWNDKGNLFTNNSNSMRSHEMIRDLTTNSSNHKWSHGMERDLMEGK